ncbi:hypothetical protein A2765_06395 [Candidatus Kaiserbacteria bacterium RIFCSPHIGHO2_01_FULL_56_24]|uniref:Bifunctional phosphoribosylaminoimidazolecarboxamide formyltransferase/inosine monophosphate cyclohydrolase n=1 Tax=Candidatus Kaiserbacteria bacterium RIFCSPHIGHO2_01_FULL_56_24 TaxID=1798487 RepID=A0A1F6DGL3_9BACT|nr:MAG: hypothetical protein A2765_06395 [Candidatus Kaiserbacteria bacterium RIFCSPHIGHO2_01_FULL_56_24]
MQFDEELNIEARRKMALRYGENPHQEAALYLDPSVDRPCVARALQLAGKELSYNNIADADAAFECVAEFDEPAVVIVKHMNPCGVASNATLRGAYDKALACDPVSAFGGIVALNRALDASLAEELTKIFLEVVIAPSIEAEALAVLAMKPNVRLLATGGLPDASAREMTVRSVAGGFLVQTRDNVVFNEELSAFGGKTVTKREPTAAELADMKFAFAVCKHVKSNAIVYVRDGATLGIGAGQMSRVISTKIAAMKAAEAKLPLKGSVMASDAFFPFPDCVEAAHEAGATAIVQPGGSKNDQASIDAADMHGMTMVFTGTRHFRH